MTAHPKLQKPSWRHHYIPKFYLKRWADENGKFVEFSKPHGGIVKPKRVSPRETGFFDKLYIMDGVPDEMADGFERQFFSPVDQRASDVLQKIEAGIDVFNNAERSAWTQFMMTVIFRNPEHVAAFKQRYIDMIRRTTKASEREWRRFRSDHHPATLYDAIQKVVSEDPSRIARAAMLTLMRSASSEKIGSHIVNMQWGVTDFGDDIPALLTSDRPVIWFGSLDHPQCHILLPVGPKRIFWAVNSKNEAQVIKSLKPKELVQFSNDTVVRRSIKFVYASSENSLPYVQSIMGINPIATAPDEILQKALSGNHQRPGRRRSKD